MPFNLFISTGLAAFFLLFSSQVSGQNCPPYTFNITTTDCFCPGEPVTLTVEGPSGNFSYYWTNGQTGNPATFYFPPSPTYGDMNVNVLDESTGCVYFAPYKYGMFCIDLVLDSNGPKCEGQATTLTATATVVNNGSAFNPNFYWSTGATGSTTTVTTAGEYEVYFAATHPNWVGGCYDTSSITISTIPAPQPVIEGPETVCEGNSIDLIAFGGPFVTHSWNPGASDTDLLTVTEPGNYSVTVTNEYGCKGTASHTVTGLPGTQAVIIGPSQITCLDTAVSLKVLGVHDQIEWSNGANTSSIWVNAGGEYSVTVTNAYGCTADDFHVLGAQPMIPPQITGPSGIPCPGDTVQLQVIGTYQSYVWSNGANSAATKVAQGGTYVVTVTNALGCTATTSYSLGMGVSPSPGISPPACSGNALQMTALGGPFAHYKWSNSDTASQTTALQPGIYTLTVTNTAGCTATAVAMVDGALFAQPLINASPYTCNGVVQLAAPAGFQHYQWSNGDTLGSTTATSSGLYSLVTTNTAGCTASAQLMVTVPPIPNTVLTGGGTFCQIDPVTLAADAGFVAYQWSSGQVNVQAISPGQPGAYAVTVTDAYGCTASAATTVDLFPIPFVQINGATAFCPGATSELQASPGFISYNWSNGANDDSIILGQSEIISLTVTDANGCLATNTVSVIEYPAPQVQITGPASICNGSSASLNVSGNFSFYEWSTGAQTPGISAVQGGIYAVTATDSNGCRDTAYFTLSTGAQLTPTIAIQTNWCQSSVNLDAGDSYANYQWSGGQTASEITVDTSGIYELWVSDAAGCSGTAQVNISVPVPPLLGLNGPASVCPGSGATLQASTGFVQYNWPDGPGNAAWQAPHSGTYALTATDAYGCTATASFTITDFTPPEPVITGPTAICGGASAELNAGQGFSEYEWSTGAATSNILVNLPAWYGLTVTDANGCTGTASHVLGIGNLPSPVLDVVIEPCGGLALLDGGAGYAAYEWSNGAQTSATSVTLSGQFNLTVTNDMGCTAVGTALVDIPQTPAVSILGPGNICPEASALLQASPGFENYLWSGGATGLAVTIDQGGGYALTATDANGCTATANFIVQEWDAPAPQIAGLSGICAGETAVLSVTPEFSHYYWPDGSTSSSFVVSSGGAYSVTVTDLHGCTGAAAFDFVEYPLPAPSVAAQPYACNAIITLLADPGYTVYQWSEGSSGPVIEVATNGDYALTVTDDNNCKATITVPVVVPPPPMVEITGTPVICEGVSAELHATAGLAFYEWTNGQTGSGISATQEGVYGVTATDAWGCSVSSAFSLSVHSPDYFLTEKWSCFARDTGVVAQFLHNQYGCDSTIVVITRLSPPMLIDVVANSDYNGSAVSCAGASDGSAQALVNGGTAPLSYQWSNGATNASLDGLPPGGLGLTITDAAGCSKTVGLLLTAPPAPSVAVTATGAPCFGVGSIELSQFYGAGAPYQVDLAGQSTLSQGESLLFDQLQAGDYPLVVTDANGCVYSSLIALPAPTPVAQEFRDTFLVDPGTLLTLEAPAGFPAQDWQWTPAAGLSCFDCPVATLLAAEEVVIEAVQTDVNGCSAMGVYVIRLRESEIDRPDIYIPNAIRPGSADNGVFTVFSDQQILNIRIMQVYDRWGELVADFRDLAPNGPAGWTGDFRGNACSPGVYGYYIELDMADGSVKRLKGGVTLVR
ncbi:MAG: hypothetical protein JNL02_13515 [Saprospiraceae bacterium]|nr:hypothetical protein [Saprospiraceae bacterium]